MYNKRSERAAKLSGGTHFTVLPMAPTAYNLSCYRSRGVSDHESSVPEPMRRRTAHRPVSFASENAVSNVTALLNAMGALNIHSAN